LGLAVEAATNPALAGAAAQGAELGGGAQLAEATLHSRQLLTELGVPHFQLLEKGFRGAGSGAGAAGGKRILQGRVAHGIRVSAALPGEYTGSRASLPDGFGAYIA
jgi:hypothetical protein